ncbi:MAG: hypothetical protein KA052_02885 [Candidatus Pacebacteria bacterium]|nr:hypothetical protein [Candidatus Paceibacterota bacterium]
MKQIIIFLLLGVSALVAHAGTKKLIYSDDRHKGYLYDFYSTDTGTIMQVWKTTEAWQGDSFQTATATLLKTLRYEDTWFDVQNSETGDMYNIMIALYRDPTREVHTNVEKVIYPASSFLEFFRPKSEVVKTYVKYDRGFIQRFEVTPLINGNNWIIIALLGFLFLIISRMSLKTPRMEIHDDNQVSLISFLIGTFLFAFGTSESFDYVHFSPLTKTLATITTILIGLAFILWRKRGKETANPLPET